MNSVAAIDGWKALWFVDPEQPVERRIAMWSFCVRRILHPKQDRKIDGQWLVRSITREYRWLPTIVDGGSLQTVDDADAIMSPGMGWIQLAAELGEQQLQ